MAISAVPAAGGGRRAAGGGRRATVLIFENKAELVKAHPAAEEITLYTAKELRSMPLHPGATRALDTLLSGLQRSDQTEG